MKTTLLFVVIIVTMFMTSCRVGFEYKKGYGCKATNGIAAARAHR